MKTLKIAIVTGSLLVMANSAHAGEVKTAGQALTLCKAQAEAEHPDYKRSQSRKIKQTRAGFKVKMKVVTEGESLTTLCEVAKDGTVTYSKV